MGRTRAANGARVEAIVARYLEDRGWCVLARNVRVGRSELDIVGLGPGADRLVAVEVRGRTAGGFGDPLERVGRNKLAAVYRAVAVLRRAGALPDGTQLPRLARRVDLLTVDDAPSLGEGMGGRVVEHLEGVEPAGGW